MRTWLSILVVFTFAGQLPAADTNAPASRKGDTSAVLKIGAGDANKYYDQEVIVTGKVAQVTIRPKVIFLNLDRPFPNSPFTVVVFPGKYLADVQALNGKAIEIRGKIRNYRDKPEIVLDNTNQLTVLGGGLPASRPNPPPPSNIRIVPSSTNAPPPSTDSTNFPEIM